MDKLYIIMPAYNEQDNIVNVIDQWYPVVEKIGNDSKLVIIDDGSKDNTYKIMSKLKGKKQLLIPLSKPNSGHGATILYGYRYAIKKNADYIFQTDSDGQTNPDEFWGFWEKRNEFDMLIGNRNNRKDGLSRIFVTRILKFVIHICFKCSVIDANTPFRLMSRETLKENLRYIPRDFNLSNIILSVVYVKRGMKVKFIPITFKQRQGGTNSINLKKIFKIGIYALRDFIIINRSLNNL